MKRIAVICAKPNNNPGMQSVDLSFHVLSKRLDATVKFFCMPHPESVGATLFLPDFPITYLDGAPRFDEILESDVIVYWGDFLHASYYHRDLTRLLMRAGLVLESSDGLSLCRKWFLQGQSPDSVLSKVLSFGTSMVATSQADYLDEFYFRDLRRFACGVRRMWAREVLSALKVGHLRRDYATSHLGADCALLLRPGDLDFLPAGKWSADLQPGTRVGIFFGGRTNLQPEIVLPFVDELCRNLKTEPEWLPWLVKSPHVYAKFLGHVPLRNTSCLLGDLFASLSKYDFIVTDTYHLCVNAWNAGTPAICLGSFDPYRKSTLGDKKKEILYSMYEASDFHINVELLADQAARQAAVAALTHLLDERTAATAIHGRIRAHTDCVKLDLVSTIEEMLGA